MAEQLIAVFNKAGWKQSKESSPDQVWAEIYPGIAVRAPAGHPDADLIARTLAEIIGSDFGFPAKRGKRPTGFFQLCVCRSDSDWAKAQSAEAVVKAVTAIPIESARWRLWACSEAPASCRASAASYRFLEDVRVLAVVVAELKLREVEREILPADVVVCADDATLEQRPERFDAIESSATGFAFWVVDQGPGMAPVEE